MRGRLRATTVRLTEDQRRFVVTEAERLGIARSAFIRDAVLVALGRRQVDVRLVELERRHAVLVERVERIARLLARTVERVTGAR